MSDPMVLTPRRTIVPLLATLGLAVGCAQSGSLGRRPMMVGTLKTEVARLESEKETYRRQALELEKENARIAGELTEERSFSGDLEARLSDARALLERRGLAADSRPGDSPPAFPAANWDDSPDVRTQPASSPGSGRKPPFAEIGRAELDDYPRGRGYTPAASPNQGVPNREPPPTRTRNEAPIRWLPVADASAENTSKG